MWHDVAKLMWVLSIFETKLVSILQHSGGNNEIFEIALLIMFIRHILVRLCTSLTQASLPTFEIPALCFALVNEKLKKSLDISAPKNFYFPVYKFQYDKNEIKYIRSLVN